MFKNVFLIASLLCAAGSFNVNAAEVIEVNVDQPYFFQTLAEQQQADARIMILARIVEDHAEGMQHPFNIQETMNIAAHRGVYMNRNDLQILHNYLHGINFIEIHNIVMPADSIVQTMLQLYLIEVINPDIEQQKEMLLIFIMQEAQRIRAVIDGVNQQNPQIIQNNNNNQ